MTKMCHVSFNWIQPSLSKTLWCFMRLVLSPGKPHGRRRLVGCSPWGREESDTTELLHFHFSLSCIGEGNGNPLQCSCLESPRDSGGWWAAVYGVARSRTRLKWLSSSLKLVTVLEVMLNTLFKSPALYILRSEMGVWATVNHFWNLWRG